MRSHSVKCATYCLYPEGLFEFWSFYRNNWLEMEQVLLSLVEYLPIQSVQALSLVNREQNEGLEAVGTVKAKYSKAGRELYADQEKKIRELVDAIERDDLYTVEHILAYKDHDMLVSLVLLLAALYKSRRVFNGISPMLTDIVNNAHSDWRLRIELLHDLSLHVLRSNDPELYDAFFLALENTKRGSRDVMLEVMGRDEIGELVWYSYSDVAAGRDKRRLRHTEEVSWRRYHRAR